MPNIFVNLPMPAGNGAGAAVDVSAQGRDKSIVMGGGFGGATVAIEVSTDGGNVFKPIWLFQAAGKKVLPVAAEFMRVFVRGRGSSGPFTATASVGADDKGALFAVIPVPAVDGPGTPVDVSALGNFTTFVVGGVFPGVTVSFEVSEDGVDYFACGASFADEGDQQSRVVVANYMRIFLRGHDFNPAAFNPTASVGAINDVSGGAMVDEKVKVSGDDTTTGFLEQKVVAGSGIAIATLDPGADEDLEISVSGADAGDILTGDPITVRGDTNAEGVGAEIARAAHQHRLEYEVEDEGVLVSARPRMDFVGDGVGAVDVPGEDLTRVTIPGPNLGDGGAVVKRSLYKGDTVSTSGNSFVDAMSGSTVIVPIDGDYWAIFEGEGMNSNANAVMEIGVSVNSTAVVVANSERDSQGNASDHRPVITTIQLTGLVAGDLVRTLFRKKSGAQSVSLMRRHLSIFKVQ
jgi:hypothetical protein